MPDFELNKVVSGLRKDYTKEQLDENKVHPNPLKQLEKWIFEAIKTKANEPNAMVLSTVGLEGKPSSRVVLLREFDENGLGFYTNFESRKGRELLGNPYVALNFFWPELERQIRIEGRVEKQPDKVSDAYFASRPKASKIGAWASKQSEHLQGRKELEHKYHELTQFYQDKEVPRPPYWGGYLVRPYYYEFWQGRPSRLHDRIFYELIDNKWKIGRLSP